MKKQEYKSLGLISIVMFITFMGYSLAYSQIIPYMESLGMDGPTRGAILSISAIIGIVGQLYLGYLSDKYQKIKEFTILAHVLFAVTVWFGYADLGQEIVLYFIFISLFAGLFKISSTIIETWIYEIDESTQKNFGVLRVFGSLGWSIGSYLVAIIVNQMGYGGLAYGYVALTIIDIVLMTLLPTAKKVTKQTKLKVKDIRKLFDNKQYTLIIVIFFWLFLILGLSSLTVVDRLIELGATSSNFSTYFSLSAFSELPLMFFGGYFLYKFGSKKILIFASVMMIIRFVLYGLAITPNQIIWISILHGVTFPFMLLAQKKTVAEQTPIELRQSAHMLMTAVTSNIPLIITPIISGFLIEIVPISGIILVAGISCVFPLVLSFFYKEKKEPV